MGWAAQVAGKALLLGVSVRVSVEETSIWISRPSKEDCPHQCRWASSNPLRAWVEQKGRGWANGLSVGAETSIFSCPWTQVLLSLRLLSSVQDLHHRSSAVDQITSTGFPGSLACSYISIRIWLVLFLWRTLTDTPPLAPSRIAYSSL